MQYYNTSQHYCLFVKICCFLSFFFKYIFIPFFVKHSFFFALFLFSLSIYFHVPYNNFSVYFSITYLLKQCLVVHQKTYNLHVYFIMAKRQGKHKRFTSTTHTPDRPSLPYCTFYTTPLFIIYTQTRYYMCV